jgi:DNA polymerase III subunit delta
VKYDNLKAFEKHLEGAASLHFSNIYLILGQDAFECREAAQKLLSFLLPDEDRSLCLTIIEGDQASAERVLTEMHSISFLSKQQVVWIQGADKLKKNVAETIENQLERIPRSHYLLLTAAALPKNGSFFKKCEKLGVVLDIADVKPWQKEKKLIDWVSARLLEERKTISHQACQHLVKYAGENQALLAQELDKLLCFIGERKEVTLQDVSLICTHLPSDTGWQLGEAIFKRETASALRICKSLLGEGSALLPLLRQIRSQFQTEYQVCSLLSQEGAPASITQEFPYMKGPILERHIQMAQQYGIERLRLGLMALDTAEMQAKNSSLDHHLLAELLIIKLTK